MVSATMGCSTGACNPSDVQAYGTCIESACSQQYTACFGPGYASGDFNGGPCGTYYSCITKCGCKDTACIQGCGAAPTACQMCIANTITNCVASSGCKSPVCGDASAQITGYKTCADLMTCCAAITDSTQKTLCNTEYQNAAGSGDAVCNSFVVAFEKLGYCP